MKIYIELSVVNINFSFPKTSHVDLNNNNLLTYWLILITKKHVKKQLKTLVPKRQKYGRKSSVKIKLTGNME